MQRRRFLSASLAAGAAAVSPRIGAAPGLPVLVLIELNGGNDGLNTLVPFADPQYARVRPHLGIARQDVLQLDEHVGMHPSLAPLMPAWRDAELAWVQGVGYTPPNRSHFRSIEIWDTASTRESASSTGWIGAAFAEPGFKRPAQLDAMVLGRAYYGPVAGAHMRSIYMRNPKSLVSRASRLRALEQSTTNTALAHVLRIGRDLSVSSSIIRDVLKRQQQADTAGMKGQLGKQLALVTRMIQGHADVGVYKLSHSGYDTHAGQGGRHRALLGGLGGALAAFRTHLRASGHWQDVVVATYSEFGRRVAQNSSGGCDHGTAAPHLLLGARVRGGLYGRYPSLTDLDRGDLRPAVSITDYYAMMARFAWNRIPAVLGRTRALV
jgi:uncharacterized protein (DUF1501 family)